MTTEQLRAACERAGLHEHPHLSGHWLFTLTERCGPLHPDDTVSFHEQNPALEPFVAARLVAEVPDSKSRELHLAFVRQFEGLPRPAAFAPQAVLRDLGDGLVLRRAGPGDAESLAGFNRVVLADPPDFAPHDGVAAWTRELAVRRNTGSKGLRSIIVSRPLLESSRAAVLVITNGGQVTVLQALSPCLTCLRCL